MYATTFKRMVKHVEINVACKNLVLYYNNECVFDKIEF